MPYINLIETIDAPFLYSQPEMSDWVLEGIGGDDKRKYRWLLNHAGISSRRIVLPDFGINVQDKLLYKNPNEAPTVQERMSVFQEQAGILINKLKTPFFHKIGLSREEITHVITVSCTGISAPGLDFQAQQLLGLPSNIMRFSINFMGCYAAFHGMKLAKTICDAEADAKVLVVDVELCSLHFQTGATLDEILANGLFADGAAMILVSNKAEGLKMNSFFQDTAANSENEMAWKLTGHQFEMRLSTYVPEILSAHIYEFMMNNGGVDADEFAFHPGGKKILDACRDALNLKNEDLKESYEVLKNYGNMSSVSIFYILQKKLIKGGNGKLFAAAFGPGLTMEGGHLEYV
jgi:predicted naringenin-chalcone synthase